MLFERFYFNKNNFGLSQVRGVILENKVEINPNLHLFRLICFQNNLLVYINIKLNLLKA